MFYLMVFVSLNVFVSQMKQRNHCYNTYIPLNIIHKQSDISHHIIKG